MVKQKKYIAVCNDELKNILAININIFAYTDEQAEKKFLDKYKSYILIAIVPPEKQYHD